MSERAAAAPSRALLLLLAVGVLSLCAAVPHEAAAAQSVREMVAFRALLHTATGATAPVLTGTTLQPGFRRYGVQVQYAVIHNPLRFGIRTVASYRDQFVESAQTVAASADARFGRRFAAGATVARWSGECNGGVAGCESGLLAGASAYALVATRRVGTTRRAPRLGLGAEGTLGFGRVHAGGERVRANAVGAGAPLTLDFTVDNPSWARDRVRRYDTRTFLFATPGVVRVHDTATEAGRQGGTLALLSAGVGVGVDAPACAVSITFGVRRAAVRDGELLLGIGTGVRW